MDLCSRRIRPIPGEEAGEAGPLCLTAESFWQVSASNLGGRSQQILNTFGRSDRPKGPWHVLLRGTHVLEQSSFHYCCQENFGLRTHCSNNMNKHGFPDKLKRYGLMVWQFCLRQDHAKSITKYVHLDQRKSKKCKVQRRVIPLRTWYPPSFESNP
jgi:hypothetical protein